MDHKHISIEAALDLLPKNFLNKFYVCSCGCWHWIKNKTRGYGRCGYSFGTSTYAHRVSFQIIKGGLKPSGYKKEWTLDHLCRNRDCVNPFHLEQVTMQVNSNRAIGSPTAINAQKTHCIRGHSLTDSDNVRPLNGGKWRRCKECANNQSLARYYAKQKREKENNL